MALCESGQFSLAPAIIKCRSSLTMQQSSGIAVRGLYVHMCTHDHAMLCRYHSHPVFEPRPSQKDNENQRNYQALFCCSQTRLEPFLGFIVGPYDLTLPSPVSCHPPRKWSAHPLNARKRQHTAMLCHCAVATSHNQAPVRLTAAL